MKQGGFEVPGAGEDLVAQLERVRLESDTLYAVIAAVGSSLDLGRILEGTVDLLTEATDCHACFVYIRDGDRLRLRAASQVYAHLVGRLELGLDEGLTGWVARTRQPAFIRENALGDPRMKYVPELEEERFQSMVAVPVAARSGEVIGVVVLHTAAPREFDEDVLNLLVHVASLVAGAIENAQLYAEARHRVAALTTLTTLSQDIAGVTGREELYAAVTGGVRALLSCELCQLHRLDPDGGRLELVASDPPGEPSPWPRPDGATVLLDLLRRRSRAGSPDGTGPALAAALGAGDHGALLVVPLTAGDEDLGVVCAADRRRRAFTEEEDGLLRAVANQVALALKRAELFERLTAENIVRDLFEAIAAGDDVATRARGAAAGVDLERPHVLVHAEPAPDPPGSPRPWPAVGERLETRLRTLRPAAVCDPGRASLRALLPLAPPSTGPARGYGELVRALAAIGAEEGVVLGVSDPRRGAGEGCRGLGEAVDAARIAGALAHAGGALAYGDLGAYRYLVHLPPDGEPRDRHRDAVELLGEYDVRRHAHLLDTLEQYLSDRRSIATTARALYIHPNTLRQRLDRIEKLSGLDLGEEDLLSLELAVKLVRLRGATGGAR